MSRIFNPLILPNGQIFENRLCKAAMEENMAEPGQIPGEALITLYSAWGKGAPGLILTGNGDRGSFCQRDKGCDGRRREDV